MSKIEVPFSLDEKDEFRFTLVLESRSVESHSMMDSGDNKAKIIDRLRKAIIDDDMRLHHILDQAAKEWKEKHR